MDVNLCTWWIGTVIVQQTNWMTEKQQYKIILTNFIAILFNFVTPLAVIMTNCWIVWHNKFVSLFT